jgi:hypothetical protein
MTVELNKKDLISLVVGTPPYYSKFEDHLVKRCGSFTGGFADSWNWHHHELNQLSEQDLWDLYVMCRDSWD